MAELNSGQLLVQRVSDVLVVEFVQTNILDQVVIERIKEELLEMVERSGHPKFIISFANVKHISSAMLGTLMAVNKKIAVAHGELRLAGIDKNLMQVFKLVRLDKILKIFPKTDDALAKFTS